MRQPQINFVPLHPLLLPSKEFSNVLLPTPGWLEGKRVALDRPFSKWGMDFMEYMWEGCPVVDGWLISGRMKMEGLEMGRSFSEKNEKWERKKKAEGGPALLGRREWQGILAWWMVGLLALSE